MRQEPDEAREDSGIENGSDTSVEAAGEATDHGGGLDEEVGVAIGGRIGCGGENIGDGGDQAELDEGKLLGAVTDDAILEVAESLDLDLGVGRGEAGEEVGVVARGGRRGRRRCRS